MVTADPFLIAVCAITETMSGRSTADSSDRSIAVLSAKEAGLGCLRTVASIHRSDFMALKAPLEVRASKSSLHLIIPRLIVSCSTGGSSKAQHDPAGNRWLIVILVWYINKPIIISIHKNALIDLFHRFQCISLHWKLFIFPTCTTITMPQWPRAWTSIIAAMLDGSSLGGACQQQHGAGEESE